MKRLILILALWIPIAAHADDITPLRTGLFANAKDVFPPLLADPREIQTALRLILPVGKTSQGGVAIGDYFGLYRWRLPMENSYVQWSVGGAAFPRFDLAAERKDFEVVDYMAAMPVDLQINNWSTRLMPYHDSSHLGDDFIADTGTVAQKYSFDAYKQLIAYSWPRWRLYGGYTFIIRNEYLNLGHWALQTGTEWRSAWWCGGHAQTFWANDLQSWERVNYNPQFTSQLGVKIAQTPYERQALSLFVEFFSGHRPEGQFFRQEETYWSIGTRFEL